eukprot:4918457-Lingulodinium_polyedra.AAC.1
MESHTPRAQGGHVPWPRRQQRSRLRGGHRKRCAYLAVGPAMGATPFRSRDDACVDRSGCWG